MTVLFDQSYQGNLWRLEIATHEGRTFANWRKWYWQGTELRPTRQGTTIPLERVAELHAALGEYLASAPPDGPQILGCELINVVVGWHDRPMDVA